MAMSTAKEWIVAHGKRLQELCERNYRLHTITTEAIQDPYSPLFLVDLNWGRTIILGIKNDLPAPMVQEWAHRVARILVVDKSFQCFDAEDLLEIKHTRPQLPPATEHQTWYYSTHGLGKDFSKFLKYRWSR